MTILTQFVEMIEKVKRFSGSEPRCAIFGKNVWRQFLEETNQQSAMPRNLKIGFIPGEGIINGIRIKRSEDAEPDVMYLGFEACVWTATSLVL